MDAKTFGAFIQTQRKALGLTQAELAEKLHVTDKAVSRWERGVGFPEVTLMEPLAQALEISLLELMQSKKQETDTLSAGEAEAAVAGALELAAEKHPRAAYWLQLISAFLVITGVELFLFVVLSWFVDVSWIRYTACFLTLVSGSLAFDTVSTALKRQITPDDPALHRDWRYYLCYLGLVLSSLLLILSFDIRRTFGSAACDASRIAGWLLAVISSAGLYRQERRRK